jgi:hypothetical protein
VDDFYLQRLARDLDQFTACKCQSATRILAFAKCGGKFTDQHDILGNTAAHHAATSEDKIEAFVKAGGKFNDKQNGSGDTPAHYAGRTLSRMRAFVRSGGKFTDKYNQNGETVGHYAAQLGAEAIKLYTDNGGKFTDKKDAWGRTAAYYVCTKGDEESKASMKAFMDALAAQEKVAGTLSQQAAALTTVGRPALKAPKLSGGPG